MVLLHDAYGGHGGIAKFNRDLLAALAAHPDCEEVVALPRFARFVPEPAPAKVTFDTNALGGAGSYLRRCLHWLFTGGRFDLVIAAHLHLLPPALLWRIRGTRPIAAVTHGVEAWAPPAGMLARRLAARADAYIAVSGVTRDRFVAWSKVDPAHCHVLPNCVDPSRFAPGPKSPALVARYRLAGKRVVMTLGRLNPTERFKGFDEVIEALPALAGTVPDIIYVIAGDGGDRTRLEEKARTLGVADRVVFTGYIDEAEKADHFRLADLYVMPSRGEGFGIVFLEALACGIPVIGSRLDGGREALLDGKLGTLVDPTDRAALVAAVRDGLERPRGVVPAELSRFSDTKFRARVRDIVDRIRDGAVPAP
jgi:glycosyltransferase involved in cell wall biosynthesis